MSKRRMATCESPRISRIGSSAPIDLFGFLSLTTVSPSLYRMAFVLGPMNVGVRFTVGFYKSGGKRECQARNHL